ncbi:hypothetical protein [Candidatus Chlorohelix sp.]|uniref:hypothetical protein n=1 Tax=Candidatus Chlorohelix sp. TaxID=3139201 RepID=UPI003056DC15
MMLNRQKPPRSNPPQVATNYLVCSTLVGYVLLLAIYYVGRYGGNWAELDSSVLSKITRNFIENRQLVPNSGEVYPNGYSYQSLTTFITILTGLAVADLQQLVYPLTAILAVLPAWLLYYELTGSLKGTILATLLLFTQPEFLFVLFRSSHEKFTRSLMLLSLFFLVKSFEKQRHSGKSIPYVILFYFAIYTLMSFNNLMGASFIFALFLTAVIAVPVGKRGLQLWHQALLRFRYIVLTCLVLAYLFTFYIYPPATHDLVFLRNIWDRAIALFLSTPKEPDIPVSDLIGWINPIVYLLLSLSTWLITLAAFGIWLGMGWKWLVKQEKPDSSVLSFVWLLYLGFGIQGVLSWVADKSGSGGHLVYRLFPSISLLSVALVGRFLANWKPHNYIRVWKVGLAFAIACLAFVSILKVTNEPALSNKWTFYSISELAALDWTDKTIQYSQVWTDFDERLSVAYAIARGESKNHNDFYGYELRETITRYLLDTSLNRLRSKRLQKVMPFPPGTLLIYDNGEAQLHRLYPKTPFQD